MSKITAKEVTRSVKRAGDSSEFGVRLRVGDIVQVFGADHFVWFVNDSRAACIPLKAKEYSFTTLEKNVAFQTDPASVNISPNSECKILKRLGREGLVTFLAQRTEERKAHMAKNNEAKTKTKEDEGPKLGHLGGFLGHPVTGVIRAMGVAGWSFKEVRHVFDKAKIQVADNTIRIQLHKGKSGAQDPAEVSKKELANLRPDPSLFAKEEKKDKGGKAAKDGKAKGKAKATEADDEDEGEEEAPAKSKKPKVKPAAKKPAAEEAEAEAEEENEPAEV